MFFLTLRPWSCGQVFKFFLRINLNYLTLVATESIAEPGYSEKSNEMLSAVGSLKLAIAELNILSRRGLGESTRFGLHETPSRPIVDRLLRVISVSAVRAYNVSCGVDF